MWRHWKHAHHQHAHEARRQMGRGWRRPRHNTPVNIIERESEYELRLHAPTYDKENIRLTVTDDTLYISGTREPVDAHPHFLLQEYPIKSFERSFELSEKADKANIKASFEEGVLTVIVPKTQAASQPDIEIDIA